MADDGEEADLLAGGADLGRDALGGPREVDHRHAQLDLRGEDPAVGRRLALELAAHPEVEVEVRGHDRSEGQRDHVHDAGDEVDDIEAKRGSEEHQRAPISGPIASAGSVTNNMIDAARHQLPRAS